MIVIPYWTNAPIYYYPVVTVVLMLVNTVVSVFALTNPEYLEAMVLRTDGTLDPVTWLTSFFIHMDYSHLLGNLLFLWCFGVIVEGRIGHLWMAICYLAVGLLESAGLQLTAVAWSQVETLELRGALGASSAIYGLMVMSFLWSFDDDLISFVLLYPFYINWGLEVSVTIYCVIYLAFDLLEAMLQGYSTGLLHVTGAMVGLLVGLVVTPTGILRGDKPTLFGWLRNRMGGPNSKSGNSKPAGSATAPAENPEEQRRQAQLDRQREELRTLFQRVQTLLMTRQFELAEERMRHLVATHPLGAWDPETMMAIIRGHRDNKAWEKADNLLKLFCEEFPKQDFTAVRIQWAEVKLGLDMPRKAIGLLKTLQGQPVAAQQKAAIRSIATRAQRMIDEGVVELE